jgi:flagellar basal body-associated protein FliL
MKKNYIWIIAIVIILIIILAGFLLFLRGNEDNWIKDSKGIWIKHGNPSSEKPLASCEK